MNVRMARESDISRLKDLLHQVLEIHAAGRPDIFISGTTKYSSAQLSEMIHNEKTPILVLCDENDITQGYAMCEVQKYDSDNMTDITTLYLDDLCIDEACRGKQYGTILYEAVKEYGRHIGAYHVTLNVWTCNPGAVKFYESMGMKVLKQMMEEIL